jgi:hypothetical protein
MRQQQSKSLLPPFNPAFKKSWDSKVWKKVSTHARLVYIALASRYRPRLQNNGRLYLSERRGAKELGFSRNTVARGFRELSFYRLIAQTNPGCLGVDGRGKAPSWRLTELHYMGEPPTCDFEKWDGTRFHEQKSPAFHRHQKRRLTGLRKAAEKQNPGPTVEPPWPNGRARGGPTAEPVSAENPSRGGSTVGPYVERLTVCEAEARLGEGQEPKTEPAPKPKVIVLARQRKSQP